MKHALYLGSRVYLIFRFTDFFFVVVVLYLDIPSRKLSILLAFTAVLLTHCRLNELPHTIYWKILISILGMSGYVI